MSKWDEIKKNLGIIADKTATKTRELTDTASLKIKIAAKESERDTEYKILGKLTYKKLKSAEGSDDTSLTAHISNTIERLDKIHGELAALLAAFESEDNAAEPMPAEENVTEAFALHTQVEKRTKTVAMREHLGKLFFGKRNLQAGDGKGGWRVAERLLIPEAHDYALTPLGTAEEGEGDVGKVRARAVEHVLLGK